ncbi:hypothetical protein F0562_032745 [Nyssa sinensis]|uniref:Uncharacterized protein n=1 Tax=Nyssa sinensis TaxID=561372 RepID=A0A5J5ASM0_9ASTE|nr:hypothetical protein F0562_032745 [Nyssa sinensis]
MSKVDQIRPDLTICLELRDTIDNSPHDRVLLLSPLKLFTAMEAEKRKRTEAGEVVDGKRMKAGDDDGGKTATTEDEEVEEFFAILRRIHVAVKYFEKRNGEGGRKLAAWRPSFDREDFGIVNDVKGQNVEQKNARLDLNAEPGAELES